MAKALKIEPQTIARILSEALPHMQRYDEETVVVKYGGHAMGERADGARFRPRHRAARAVRDQSGRRAWRRAADRGHAQPSSASNRNSPAACASPTPQTVEIVEMVLAGSINKQIVGYINAAGGKAIGLCGKDGNMVHGAQGDAHRRRSRTPTSRRWSISASSASRTKSTAPCSTT